MRNAWNHVQGHAYPSRGDVFLHDRKQHSLFFCVPAKVVERRINTLALSKTGGERHVHSNFVMFFIISCNLQKLQAPLQYLAWEYPQGKPRRTDEAGHVGLCGPAQVS